MLNIAFANVYASAFRRLNGVEQSIDLNPGTLVELARKLRAKADKVHAHSRAAWDALKDDKLPDYIWDGCYDAACRLDDIYYPLDTAADEMELAAEKWDELMQHLDNAFDGCGEIVWKEVNA